MRKAILILLLGLLLFFCPTTYASWSETLDLPYTLASSQAFFENNKLYVSGGGGDTNHATTLSAENNNGNFSGWSYNDFPPLFWHTIVGSSDRRYVVGGYNFQQNIYSTNVYKISLNNNSINYSEMNSLPEGIALSDSQIINGRIYIFGGSTQNGNTNLIYSTKINLDGSLENWIPSGSLPESVNGHKILTIGKDVYLIGGNANNGTSSRVYKTELNSDGKVDNWIRQEDLPIDITRFELLKIGKYIAIFGGASSSGYSSKIFLSEYEDGILKFTESQVSLPINNCCSPIIDSGDYIYQIGGHDGGYYSKIWKLKKSELITEDLAVPLIKQANPLWKNLAYDNAAIWSPSNKTIATWGCAITAASMVLNYYGLDLINPTTKLDPGTLNAWLKTQEDGYTPNGLLNWLAISRLSKLISGINPLFQFDAVEYDRQSEFSKLNIETDLSNNIPDILEEPGHFVVATGTTNSTVKINDPFYLRTSLEEGYNNTYISVRRLIPSHTNLSYIMVSGSNLTDFVLKTNNKSLGTSFIQGPIIDQSSLSLKSGDSIKIHLLKNPDSQKYNLTLSTTKTGVYNSQIYLYDKNGEVKIIKILDIVKTGKNNEYSFIFNQDGNSSAKIEKRVTFTMLLDEIQQGKTLGLINPFLVISLSSSIRLAELSYNFNQQKTAKSILSQITKTIELSKGKLISDSFSSILTNDINTLLRIL